MNKCQDDVVFVRYGRRHGMSLLLARHLLKEVMERPGQTIYLNFELPKPLKETIEKYATVEKVKAPDELKGL